MDWIARFLLCCALVRAGSPLEVERPPAALARALDEQDAPEAPAPDEPAGLPTEEELMAERQRELRQRDWPTTRFSVDDLGPIGRALLGWGGARRWLEERGLLVEMLLTVDSSVAPSGGADPGGTALRSLFEVAITLDSERTLGYRGGTFFTDVQWIAGVDGSRRFGVLQPFSNIDAEHRFQVGRIWYEHAFDELGTRIRLGKIDANSQFAYVEEGAWFLHSSMGVSPTLAGLPTYPDPAFAVTVAQRLSAAVELRAGLFDGAAQAGVRTGSTGVSTLLSSPDDLFWIAELDLSWGGELHPGRVGLGGWHHDGEFARYEGGSESGTQGLYLVADQRLWSDRRRPDRGLGAFLQLGWADPDVWPIEDHLGLGLSWNLPFSERMLDRIGLGVSRAGLSDQAGSGTDGTHETAVELFYGFEPAPWLRLKPDLQYVANPGGSGTLDDAWIASLRLTLSF